MAQIQLERRSKIGLVSRSFRPRSCGALFTPHGRITEHCSAADSLRIQAMAGRPADQ